MRIEKSAPTWRSVNTGEGRELSRAEPVCTWVRDHSTGTQAAGARGHEAVPGAMLTCPDALQSVGATNGIHGVDFWGQGVKVLPPPEPPPKAIPPEPPPKASDAPRVTQRAGSLCIPDRLLQLFAGRDRRELTAAFESDPAGSDRHPARHPSSDETLTTTRQLAAYALPAPCGTPLAHVDRPHDVASDRAGEPRLPGSRSLPSSQLRVGRRGWASNFISWAVFLCARITVACARTYPDRNGFAHGSPGMHSEHSACALKDYSTRPCPTAARRPPWSKLLTAALHCLTVSGANNVTLPTRHGRAFRPVLAPRLPRPLPRSQPPWSQPPLHRSLLHVLTTAPLACCMLFTAA